jgi:hypothetical protein
MRGWVSPRLRVRFDTAGTDLILTGPDGRRFPTPAELDAQREAGEARERADRLGAQLRALGVEPES